MRTTRLVYSIVGIFLCAVSVMAQNPVQVEPPKFTASEADLAAIKQTALDYVEGWYEGNTERMERALHPDLAKRIVFTDPKSGRSRLDHMGAMGLVLGVRNGGGK